MADLTYKLTAIYSNPSFIYQSIGTKVRNAIEIVRVLKKIKKLITKIHPEGYMNFWGVFYIFIQYTYFFTFPRTEYIA